MRSDGEGLSDCSSGLGEGGSRRCAYTVVSRSAHSSDMGRTSIIQPESYEQACCYAYRIRALMRGCQRPDVEKSWFSCVVIGVLLTLNPHTTILGGLPFEPTQEALPIRYARRNAAEGSTAVGRSVPQALHTRMRRSQFLFALPNAQFSGGYLSIPENWPACTEALFQRTPFSYYRRMPIPLNFWAQPCLLFPDPEDTNSGKDDSGTDEYRYSDAC